MSTGESAATVAEQFRVTNCRTLALPEDTAPYQIAGMTVVICAYTVERWQDLCRAVDSVLAEPFDRLDVIVVVDHSDELYALAAERFVTHERVTVVPNDQTPGLSGARNTGVARATGDVVAFVDDDAAVQPGWASTLSSHYRDGKVAAVGGFAAPVWPTGRPRWLPPEFDWVVGCSYVGQPTRVADVRNPLGCNMSVRRDVLAQIGGFRSEVGRVGSKPVGGEETELFLRLRTALPGRRVLLDPTASVHHHVSADRATMKYFVRRCYHEGVSKAVVVSLADTRGALSSERDYSLRVLPRALVRNLVSASGDGLARAATVLIGLAVTSAGYLRGTLARRTRKRGN